MSAACSNQGKLIVPVRTLRYLEESSNWDIAAHIAVQTIDTKSRYYIMRKLHSSALGLFLFKIVRIDEFCDK